MSVDTLQLHDLSQRLWLDVVTRQLLFNRTQAGDAAELWLNGTLPKRTLFERGNTDGSGRADSGGSSEPGELSGEDLVFELAMQDLKDAADRVRGVHDTSGGRDGWVSLEVSPLLATDDYGTVRAALQLHERAARPNLLIEIPATPENMPAIEQAIFLGIPLNVTLLFAREHCTAVARAYMRGVERRVAAGVDPAVDCLASLVISGWDVAVSDHTSAPLHNRLGIAVAMRSTKAWRDELATERWQVLAGAGARAPRLLWDDAGARHPAAGILIETLAATGTIDTVPVATLLACADGSNVAARHFADTELGDPMLEGFWGKGIDLAAHTARLERERAIACSASWSQLLAQNRQRVWKPQQAQST